MNTDVILPGRYLALRRPEELREHCLEGLDPGFVGRVRPGDILAVGRNFGCDSSREHAVVALLAAGVGAIVAVSAARIFYRNAINLGLPVLICPEAAAELAEGCMASVDLEAARIRQDASEWRTQPLGDEVRAILAAGGLVPRIRASLVA